MSLSRLSAVVRDIRYVNLKLKMKVVPKITLKKREFDISNQNNVN